jgi:cell division septation protein DedD
MEAVSDAVEASSRAKEKPPGVWKMALVYEIRVREHLDNCRANRFEGFFITHEEDGTTALAGPVADQAALHGLLMKVRDLGLTLLSVNQFDVSNNLWECP